MHNLLSMCEKFALHVSEWSISAMQPVLDGSYPYLYQTGAEICYWTTPELRVYSYP